MLYYPQGPRRPLLSPPVTASRERMVAAPPMLIHPGAVDSCGLRGFSRPDAQPPAVPPPGPLGMKKERRSPRRPFPVKICENSCPPSRRPCPLSLDIPGFSHVLPSCPALSRLSQLSCLFTVANSAKVPLVDIGKALGHKDITITGRIYTHLFDQTHQEVLNMVASRICIE